MNNDNEQETNDTTVKWLRRSRLLLIVAMPVLMLFPFMGVLASTDGGLGSGPTYDAGEFEILKTGWDEFQYWLIPPVLFFIAWAVDGDAVGVFRRWTARILSFLGFGVICFYIFALVNEQAAANVACTAGKIYLAAGIVIYVLTLLGNKLRRATITSETLAPRA